MSEPFRRPFAARRLALPLLLAGAASLGLGARADATGPGPGQTRAEYLARVRETKARARELVSEEARQRMDAARRWAVEARAAKRRGLAPPPHAEPTARILEGGDRASYEVDVAARRFPTHASVTVPANTRVNATTGDAASTAQSDASIAAWGDFLLVAWNDGLGPQRQGYGFSTDGGQTFVDGGAPPAPAGWTWSSDPIVTVNEKTGTFFYCALVDPTPFTNGIGVVAATFSGGKLAWGTPVLVRSANNASVDFDMPSMVADSTSGHLYLACTTFDATAGSQIDVQCSTDGGATWSRPARISGAADEGAVQGARAVVGPSGEVYVAWLATGRGAEDFIRLRKSVSQGATWEPEATPASLHLNFGTGAPGFNRARGADYPSIAVDRTHGSNRGRVHLAWTESLDPYDDPVNTLGNVVESEPNGSIGGATAFAPGLRLRGTLGAANDLDYFAFAATEGNHYVFECDSVPNPLYTLRIFCGQDTMTRLAFAGDVSAPAGGRGQIVWTAPATDTYYLRVAYVSGGSPGGYRIATGVVGAGLERARDSRDVFAAWSDDGATWSTPVRVSDAAPRYGEFLPEVTVAADGTPYVSWFDWRDDGCGSRSYQYVARSTDGGDTWSASQRFSDVQNHWTNISLQSDLSPDMGERGHLAADGRFLRPVWTDGRSGNPDVYAARIATGLDVTVRQGDLVVDAGSAMNAGWTVTNLNPLFANAYTWTLKSQREWPLPPTGTVTAAADSTAGIHPTITVPDSAAPGPNRMCLMVTDARGAQSRACCFTVMVQRTPLDVPILTSAFDLQARATDPASRRWRIDFSLPYDGPVRVTIYGIKGDRIRTLADGSRSAGPNTITWDGRDDRGDQADAGAYFCRLEGFGSVKVQRLFWLR